MGLPVRKARARRARRTYIPPLVRAGRRALLVLLAAPLVVRLLVGAILIVLMWSAVNWAYQVIRKPTELFFPVSGAHKGVPLGPQPIEHTQTWDMDGAAANFPDINFVIFHVGLPFIDETCWQLIRYPNLYASIAATVNFVVRAPRMFAEILGKLLFWCGEDKIIYGSEAPLWHPQWALRAFMDFQIPEDLCAGYGYPQLTDQAKRKILGENLLRLHGLDLAEARAKASAKP